MLLPTVLDVTRLRDANGLITNIYSTTTNIGAVKTLVLISRSIMALTHRSVGLTSHWITRS